MNYLRNLKSIHMKDVKLPKESLNYLEKVYDACETSIRCWRIL